MTDKKNKEPKTNSLRDRIMLRLEYFSSNPTPENKILLEEAESVYLQARKDAEEAGDQT